MVHEPLEVVLLWHLIVLELIMKGVEMKLKKVLHEQLCVLNSKRAEK